MFFEDFDGVLRNWTEKVREMSIVETQRFYMF